jgi:hypothetical protein
MSQELPPMMTTTVLDAILRASWLAADDASIIVGVFAHNPVSG